MEFDMRIVQTNATPKNIDAVNGVQISGDEPSVGDALYFDPTVGHFVFGTITGTGPTGATGNTGPTGVVGPQGPQGVQGPQGAQGAQGPQGSQGPQGVQGDQGPVGDQGPQGFQGGVGPIGATGPQGTQGAQGPVGDQGDRGPVGNTGAVGAVGAVGPVGDQGPQGIAGNQGPNGAVGAVGPTGATGPIGLSPWHRIVDSVSGETNICYNPQFPTPETTTLIIGPSSSDNLFRAYCSGPNAGSLQIGGHIEGMTGVSNALIGGGSNVSDADRCAIIGGASNSCIVNTVDCVIAGGENISNLSSNSVALGGRNSSITAEYCVIMGSESAVSGRGSVIIGGTDAMEPMSASDAVRIGGINNLLVAGATSSVIVSGRDHNISQTRSGIVGGEDVDLNGVNSAALSTKSSNLISAAGFQTSTNCAFVSSDGCAITASTNTAVVDSVSSDYTLTNNSLAIACVECHSNDRSSSGANFMAGSNLSIGENVTLATVMGNGLTINHGYTFHVSDGTQFTSVNPQTFRAFMRNGFRVFTNAAQTTGLQVLPSGNSWSALCDVNAKENVRELSVDAFASVATKLIDDLPIYSYRWRDVDSNHRAWGPTAQDWRRCFGELLPHVDDRTIDSNDMDGIALMGLKYVCEQLNAIG